MSNMCKTATPLPKIKSYRNFREFSAVSDEIILRYTDVAIDCIQFTPYKNKIQMLEILASMKANASNITGARKKALWACLHFISDFKEILELELLKFCRESSRTVITKTHFKSWIKDLGCDTDKYTRESINFIWDEFVEKGIIQPAKGRYYKINKQAAREGI